MIEIIKDINAWIQDSSWRVLSLIWLFAVSAILYIAVMGSSPEPLRALMCLVPIGIITVGSIFILFVAPLIRWIITRN